MPENWDATSHADQRRIVRSDAPINSVHPRRVDCKKRKRPMFRNLLEAEHRPKTKTGLAGTAATFLKLA
jgi:hypothetical protein